MKGNEKENRKCLGKVIHDRRRKEKEGKESSNPRRKENY